MADWSSPGGGSSLSATSTDTFTNKRIQFTALASFTAPELWWTEGANKSGMTYVTGSSMRLFYNGAAKMDIGTSIDATGASQLVGPSGTLANPGLVITATSTGGFYRIGAANIGLSLNGVLAVNFLMTQISIKTRVDHTEVETITGATTDGYSAALKIDPGYTAATAQTVTRHNYLDIQDVSLAGAGPAALTDACVMRFDAAIGTHKAVDAASTKVTVTGVDAWIKVNINGTILFMPCYLSKTA